ncbi:MAG: DUF1289 domain-containing protein [Burkholderiales bacterium]|nr:DUF1289 domain-containing protein [Burkholderiales bacterium]
MTGLRSSNDAAQVESPCIKRCAMDARSGYCLGCGRTLEEITNWSTLSVDQRAAVVRGLEGRLSGAASPPGWDRRSR